MQLFPSHFDKALPYPSFEVHDLHTVDDGVWQVGALMLCHSASSSYKLCVNPEHSLCDAPLHLARFQTILLTIATVHICFVQTAQSGVALLQHLLPSLREPAGWDVVIGHYLGVDHVGHTFDVHSPHMSEKLQQMDQHVAQVRCGYGLRPFSQRKSWKELSLFAGCSCLNIHQN